MAYTIQNSKLKQRVALLTGHRGEFIPNFDTSLDDITLEFDKEGYEYSLKKRIDKKKGKTTFMAYNDSIAYCGEASSPARAMCQLFIKLRELDAQKTTTGFN